MRKRFVVELAMPPGATSLAVRNYIEDAVASMKGSYRPEDPLFDLDGNSVKAFFYYSKRGKKNGFR